MVNFKAFNLIFKLCWYMIAHLKCAIHLVIPIAINEQVVQATPKPLNNAIKSTALGCCNVLTLLVVSLTR